MQTTTFHRGRVLLYCAIATAAFFTTVILLDYLRIENKVVAAAREFFLIPCFLMLLILPFFLLIAIAKKIFNKVLLLYAAITWKGTLLLVILKTVFFPNNFLRK